MMKTASPLLSIAMKVFLTIMTILLFTPVFVHQGIEIFFYLSLFTAGISYLMSSLVFIISARSGHRVMRFLLSLVFFPLWMWIYFNSFRLICDIHLADKGFLVAAPYYFWSPGLPVLLFLAICVLSRNQSKKRKM